MTPMEVAKTADAAFNMARFRPAPRRAVTMIAFLMRPTERTYTRFMRQCSYDLDGLREEIGARWQPFRLQP